MYCAMQCELRTSTPQISKNTLGGTIPAQSGNDRRPVRQAICVNQTEQRPLSSLQRILPRACNPRGTLQAVALEMCRWYIVSLQK